jgi:hypothetical protein
VLRHSGKERNEGGGGDQSSDTTERTRGTTAARGRSSERVRQIGVGQRVSGEKGRRERESESKGEVAVGWDPLAKREGGRAAEGGQPRGGAQW